VVRHGNRFFQVKRQSRYAPTKSQVVVCEREDGKLEIRYGGRRLCHEKIGGQPRMAKTLSTNAGPKGDRNMKKRSCGNVGVVEKWKTTSRFPTFPPPSLGLNEDKTKKQPTASAEKKGTFYRDLTGRSDRGRSIRG